MGLPFLSEQNRRLVKQRAGYINSQCCEEIVSDDGRLTSPSSLTRRSRLIKLQRGSTVTVRYHPGLSSPVKGSQDQHFFLCSFYLRTAEWN